MKTWVALAMGALVIVGAGALFGVATGNNDQTIEVRVTARGTADGTGRVEVAIQQRLPSGAWGERQQGRARFMSPALIAEGTWKNATPVQVGSAPTAAKPEVVVDARAELEPASAPGYPAPGIRVSFVVVSEVARVYRWEMSVRPQHGIPHPFIHPASYDMSDWYSGTVGAGTRVDRAIGFGSMGSYFMDYGRAYEVRVCIRVGEDDACGYASVAAPSRAEADALNETSPY